MSSKKLVTSLALICTVAMLMAHAMALTPTSSDKQERIPGGLRRMIETLQKCDFAIANPVGPLCLCFVDEAM